MSHHGEQMASDISINATAQLPEAAAESQILAVRVKCPVRQPVSI